MLEEEEKKKKHEEEKKKSDTSKTKKKQEKDDDAVEIQKKKNEEVPKPQLSPARIFLDQQTNKVASEVPKNQSKRAFEETMKVSTSQRQPTKSQLKEEDIYKRC